jgi:DNA-binding response OmpR family regulator
MSKRVLVVEDDEILAQVLSHNLSHEGFEVRCVNNGTQALAEAKAFAPDVALLDVTLPGTNGIDLCRAWSRERRFSIILVTAKDRKDDELRGFRAGADDYVTKPFDLDTLLARIHAVLRRARPNAERLVLGDIVIDFATFTARQHGNGFDLTHKEFEILRYLAERANTVVHRDDLLRAVWGYPEDPFTRSVDKAIARLRKKIEPDPRHPTFIHTAHGDGYSLSLSASGGDSEAT